MNHSFSAVRRAVLWVGTALGVLGLSQAWRIATDHLGSAWPDHAKWHALIGGLLLALLSGTLLVALWGPYRAGRHGIESTLALLLAGPGLMVGLGMWLLPSGAPGGGDAVLAATAVTVGLITAALAWRTKS